MGDGIEDIELRGRGLRAAGWLWAARSDREVVMGKSPGRGTRKASLMRPQQLSRSAASPASGRCHRTHVRSKGEQGNRGD